MAQERTFKPLLKNVIVNPSLTGFHLLKNLIVTSASMLVTPKNGIVMESLSAFETKSVSKADTILFHNTLWLLSVAKDAIF